MIWARMLAYITGTVDQELLLRNEYLAAENRILRAQIKGRLLLSDAEKLRWLRSPTGSDGKPWKNWRLSRGRIRCWPGTESSSPTSSTDRSFANSGVVPELARKPSGWWCGWQRKIPGGAMAGLWAPWPTWVTGSRIRRWAIFSAAMIFHRLVATDFFTVEALTLRGLITYYVMFFIHLESRRICLAGVTFHPDQEWMEQMARNVTMEDSGFLINRKYLLHDRDSKYCSSFRQMIEAGSVKTLALPARSPNLNAYAERWVRSVKEECLAKLILLGEGSLRRALRHYEAHYHEERNHQGKDNVLLFALPTQAVSGEQGKVRCGERLGGLLKYYEREAA